MVSAQRVNDSKSHVIVARRDGRKGELVVDDLDPVTAPSSGQMSHLNGNGNIYIGLSLTLLLPRSCLLVAII